ncbi:MAG: PspC domain-containing protein [Bacteroidetes bacterium]|nr:PspC domain-containing protein [Bacteroidota bacterium]
MQRIIQINIAGRVIPIEEDAYQVLKDYLTSLERLFSGEEGKDDIIQDIEYRISELFSIRLQNGVSAVDRADVQKVIDTLGPAHELDDNTNAARTSNLPVPYVRPANQNRQQSQSSHRRLFRNTNDKVLGGVCSGLANYFDIDPVIVRLVFAILFFGLGIGAIGYIIGWIVIPAPRTPEEFAQMSGGTPMDFHTMASNMGEELQDLKKRGEAMSRELRDFFSKKK